MLKAAQQLSKGLVPVRRLLGHFIAITQQTNAQKPTDVRIGLSHVGVQFGRHRKCGLKVVARSIALPRLGNDDIQGRRATQPLKDFTPVHRREEGEAFRLNLDRRIQFDCKLFPHR